MPDRAPGGADDETNGVRGRAAWQQIDIASAPSLRRHLLSLPDCSTVLELSGVGLLSAAGLTELVDLRDRLTRADARLALAGAPPSVRRVLTITGLDDTMLLADSLHDAVRP
jgi:anti-sigma B factor antagonist